MFRYTISWLLGLDALEIQSIKKRRGFLLAAFIFGPVAGLGWLVAWRLERPMQKEYDRTSFKNKNPHICAEPIDWTGIRIAYAISLSGFVVRKNQRRTRLSCSR